MDQVPTAKVAAMPAKTRTSPGGWRGCSKPSWNATSLRKLYDEVEIPLIDVLAELEFNGIRLDVPFLNRLSVDMAGQLETIETEIHGLAGRAFNIASPKQLRVILFDELKLPATEADRHVRRGQHRSRDARKAGRARPRAAAQDHRAPPARQAQGHLRRRAAGAGEPADRPAAHVVQPDGGGDRPAYRPATRTCRTSRPAPKWAGRSARRSSPATAGCC